MDGSLRGLARLLSIAGATMKHSVQQPWGFRAPRAFSDEFRRVHGGPAGTGARGPFCHLDEGRSYWVVIWRAQGTTAEVHPVGRWITYAPARPATPSWKQAA
jgi:hypothetical protein